MHCEYSDAVKDIRSPHCEAERPTIPRTLNYVTKEAMHFDTCPQAIQVHLPYVHSNSFRDSEPHAQEEMHAAHCTCISQMMEDTCTYSTYKGAPSCKDKKGARSLQFKVPTFQRGQSVMLVACIGGLCSLQIQPRRITL